MSSKKTTQIHFILKDYYQQKKRILPVKRQQRVIV